nr:dienelactone hydrolase family protein [uncultured Tolumonas sp.]
MRQFISALILTFLCAISVNAQPLKLPPMEADAMNALTASPRHGEWVKYDAGHGDKVDAWVVYPERSDKAPVVILIHEIFGLTDWARATADQLAAEGFLVIAPDFLSGKGKDGAGTASFKGDEVRAAISNLTPAELERRLNGAAVWAATQPAGSKRYGVVGFCWGGGVAFSWATKQPKLGAAVVYYGVPPKQEALSAIKSPILGLYGGADARVTSTVASTQAEMKRLAKRYEVKIYDGAGHAFLRQQNGMNGANLKAATDGWATTIPFLKETLEGKAK